MSLRPGTSLGPYEIEAPIGAGGMGQVFKARDSRLERSVALKILSPDYASEESARERLKREARAAARLNHPHICALYDVGSQDGTDFLVMELLEGETLAQRLARGALPRELALEYGKQIAEAIDAAHRQGIVHRDLKPSNVMLTKAGVKVLDFGLAKQTAVLHQLGVSEAPTRQKDLTAEHALVGTLQYMAPEQLEGKEVDSRTDVFAFGAVLFEMLTGRKAFSGGSPASLIASILSTDPPVPESPPRLGEILRRCLAKSPDERWQSLRDVSALLGWIGDDRAPTPKRSWLVPAAGAVVLAALVGTAVWLQRLELNPKVVRLSTKLPAETFLGSGVADERRVGGSRPSRTSITLSPDGDVLVFSAVGGDSIARLYSRRLDEEESVRMEGTDGAVDPVFSPEGDWVAFWSNGELRKVKPGGGLPVTLCKAAPTFGISWGPDDSIVFAGEASGLSIVSASGGEPKALTTLTTESGELSHRLPHHLRDGSLLFTISRSSQTGEQSHIAWKRIESAEPQILIEDGSDARYAESGHIVFVRDSVLLAAPFVPDQSKATEAPVPVLPSVMQARNSTNSAIETDAAQFGFASNGTLAYATGGRHPTEQRSLLWLDRSGRSDPLDLPPDNQMQPRLSRDEMVLAVWRSQDVAVLDLGRGTKKRLGVTSVTDGPIWSPDGRDLVCLLKQADSPPGIFRKSAHGNGSAERLTTGMHSPSSWSKDGRTIAFVSNDDLWTLSLGDLKVERLTETPFREMHPEFSPDGNWLAYVSNESGRNEVYVRAFPEPGGTFLISNAGGHSPAWAHSGRELYYLNYDPAGGRYVNDFMVVDVSFSPKFSASRPRKLFSREVSSTLLVRNYDVSSDGRFLVLTPYDPPTEKVTEIQVVLNWFEELKRLAPAEN